MTSVEKDLLIEKINTFFRDNQFLDLKSDLVFKAFFENENNLLIFFLTSFLPLSSDSKIIKITVLNPQIYPESRKQNKSITGEGKSNDQLDRNFVLDLKIEFERIFKGERIQEISNVEMQTTGSSRLLDRIVVYASRLLSKLLGKGDDFKKLTTVFSILLSAKNLKIFKDIKDFYHVSRLRRDDSYEVFSNILIFVVVKLQKFDKKLEKLDNIRDCWCYLMKHAKELDTGACKKLIEKGEDTMAEAIHRLLDVSQDSKLQEYEEARAKHRFDQMSREADALEEGIEKGIKEGLVKGRAEGRREVALNMLKAGIDIKVILDSTRLSKKELEDLKTK